MATNMFSSQMEKPKVNYEEIEYQRTMNKIILANHPIDLQSILELGVKYNALNDEVMFTNLYTKTSVLKGIAKKVKIDSGLIYDQNQESVIHLFGQTNIFEDNYTEKHIIEPLISAHPNRNPESIEQTKIVRIMHQIFKELKFCCKMQLFFATFSLIIHWASFMAKIRTSEDSKALAIQHAIDTGITNFDDLDNEVEEYLALQVLVGIILALGFLINLLGITRCRHISLHLSAFLYLIGFIFLIASFGIATTLSDYGDFADVDFSTNSFLFFFIIPCFVYGNRGAKYLRRLLVLTGEKLDDYIM